jgi:hypothetical protein
MSIQGLPGGANIAVSTTPVAVNLGPLAGYVVYLCCNEQDILVCFTEDESTSTTLVTAAQAPSLTALVADPIGATIKAERQVLVKYSRLVVRTASGSGTLVIKPISKA